MMDGSAFVSKRARRATPADVLQMILVASRAYDKYPVEWGRVSVWLHEILEEPDIFAAVCGDAAIICRAHCWEGLPSVKNVTVLFIAGVDHVWDAVRCLRMAAAWGHQIGSHTLKVDAETGVDLGPLVKRIGLPYEPISAFTVKLNGA